jgi:hypothetical protein
MNSDLIYNNDDYLTDEFKDNIIDYIDCIEWDDLENCWIDNLGNCYKTIQDIPKELIDFII